MRQLTVNNSESQITGLSSEETKRLRKALSYTVNPNAQFFSGTHRSPTRCLMDAKGRFPTGLLPRVKKELNLDPGSILDHRIKPDAPRMLHNANLGIIPYDEQRRAVYACADRDRGIISMPTGTGKSLVIALIIQELQVKTLVVVPSLELKTQLTTQLTTQFGSAVGKTIYVENIDSIPMIETSDYDCVIIDEFHHSAASTYRKLNKRAWNKVYYRFGLTATPFRSQDHEQILLESVLSEVIYELDYHTAVKKGYIVPVEAYYFDLPKRDIDPGVNNWHSVYAQLVVHNPYRNEIIANLLMQLDEAKLSALCLVKEIAHGAELADLTNCKFASGESDDNRIKILEFNLKEINTLIGTTGILGEGVDTKPCEYVIIAGLGKSKNQFMQQVGRGLRKYSNKKTCKIILFCDTSHKWTRAHFRAQVKYLRDEYGVVPVKLEI